MRLPILQLTGPMSGRSALLLTALALPLLIDACGGEVDGASRAVVETASVAMREKNDADAAVSQEQERLPLSPPVGEDWPPAPIAMAGDSCSARLIGSHRTYDLGPDQPYTEAAAVPWLSLQAGDVVNVHHRPQPYRVKIALAAAGRADAPVVINGVTDAACNRPVITAEDARIAADAAASGFFDANDSERLGTILLHRRPTDALGQRPSHVTLRNLEITGARASTVYTGHDGVERTHLPGAAGVYAIVVDDLTIENSVIHGNGNGVFVNSRDDADVSSHIVLRANAIYDNGNPGSYLEHNVYVQARRALYEGNYLGQLVVDAEGTSLKDRSSGTVIRYNRIDAAARALDLVEIEGGIAGVFDDPLYADAWVYGNSIVNDLSTEARSAASLVQWSGDNDPRYFRKGTLHWYHNTVQTLGDKEQFWYIALFDAPQRGERVRVRASAFVHEGSSERYLVKDSGHVELTGANYLTDGWLAARGSQADVQVEPPIPVPGRPIELDGFPVAGGPLIDVAAAVPIDGVAVMSDEASLPIHPSVWRVDHQPAAPWGLTPRQVTGDGADVGAFEAPESTEPS